MKEYAIYTRWSDIFVGYFTASSKDDAIKQARSLYPSILEALYAYS